MPILDIEIVLNPQEGIEENLSQRLADAAGNIFGSAPAETWVKIWLVDAANYAENYVIAGNECYPVFINVLKAKLKTGQELKEEVKNLTKIVAEICKRPVDNVHIIYQPAGLGRVAFGGKIRI